ncbi:MAG: DUF4162 domain-containing protein, partial [Thermoleophilia bacterium]
PAGLSQQINEQNGVTAVNQQDDGLTISSMNSAHSLPPVLKVLEDSGCEVSHLEIYTPNLEKLFIHLTGKELRE